MKNEEYSDEQKTPWLSGHDSPFRPGIYEIRLRNSPQVVNGHFKDGRWQLEFGGEFSPLSYAPGQFEWRGLNFEPKPQPKPYRGPRVFVFDGR